MGTWRLCACVWLFAALTFGATGCALHRIPGSPYGTYVNTLGREPLSATHLHAHRPVR